MNTVKIGEVVPVRFVGTALPVVMATVTAVRGCLVDIRYADDASIFAGLRGLIRMPGWTKEGQ